MGLSLGGLRCVCFILMVSVALLSVLLSDLQKVKGENSIGKTLKKAADKCKWAKKMLAKSVTLCTSSHGLATVNGNFFPS